MKRISRRIRTPALALLALGIFLLCVCRIPGYAQPYAYIGTYDKGVSIIDTQTNVIVDRIDTEIEQYWFSVNSDASRVYISHFHQDLISVIDTSSHSVIQTVATLRPGRVAESSDGLTLYQLRSDAASLEPTNPPYARPLYVRDADTFAIASSISLPVWRLANIAISPD